MSERSKVRTGASARRIIQDDRDPMALIGQRVTVVGECFAFDGNLDRYGQFQGRGAHRWVYEAIHGPQPTEHLVHHKCEHPGCVNPQHLHLVTPAMHIGFHQAMKEWVDPLDR